MAHRTDKIIELGIVAIVLFTTSAVVGWPPSSNVPNAGVLYLPASWTFVFLTAAVFLQLMTDTDLPERIRKTRTLRTQTRVLCILEFFLGVVSLSSTGAFTRLPDVVVVSGTCTLAVVSLGLLIVHLRGYEF
jgi:hypothetical protein